MKEEIKQKINPIRKGIQRAEISLYHKLLTLLFFIY